MECPSELVCPSCFGDLVPNSRFVHYSDRLFEDEVQTLYCRKCMLDYSPEGALEIPVEPEGWWEEVWGEDIEVGEAA